MERSDQKIIKEITWERNYNAGTQTDVEDISTVELSGTHDEADIIVAGLGLLRSELIQDKAVGRSGGRFRLDKVEKLLSEIEYPNYGIEPEVIKITNSQ